MYRLNQVKLNINHDEKSFRQKIAKLVGVSVNSIDWSTFIILHKSIDARDKNNILFVYNVAFELDKKISISNKKFKFEKYEPKTFNPYIDENSIRKKIVRPIVIGFGPAGIFAAYIFAINGYKPIIIERGKSLNDRIKDTEKFFQTMEINEESNVCFGEGGAGAFSDGKLNTNNKDKTGLYHYVLETLVKFGADKKILYENLPHIGTDKLVKIIENMRNEILNLGGEIHYNTKFVLKNGNINFLSANKNVATDDKLESDMPISDDTPIVLAIGNSSRDTFRDLIQNGFDVKAKSIAVGYRIVHNQLKINEAQYGKKNCNDCKNDVLKILGPATYKLTFDVGNDHSVYSFCMCPGGYVINSSNKKGQLSINGMSYNDRDGKYANSAIVETITPYDINFDLKSLKTEECTPLQMIEFQEKVEKAAFELENGYIPYITSSGLAVSNDEVFKGQAKYSKELKSIYENIGLRVDINKDIEKALKHFNKIIPGFYEKDDEKVGFIIAGVETRTSSPLKLNRDDDCMCNIPNFYPAGEGLGHGGGILSCAADGCIVAKSIMKKMNKK